MQQEIGIDPMYMDLQHIAQTRSRIFLLTSPFYLLFNSRLSLEERTTDTVVATCTTKSLNSGTGHYSRG